MIMKHPLVSVIIPNYNYGPYLPQALDSVLAQSYPHVEIVVVDDGSQDESESIIRSYGNRVRSINQKNQGVSAARNRGARESTGELLAFLDADDVWLPAKLERQVELILCDPEIGLVHCGIEEINSEGTSLRTFLDGMQGWVSREMLRFNRSVIIASGSTALVPRRTFEAVSGFDPKLSTSADWEFCYRVASRQRVGFIPEPLVKYRIHGSNMHANIRLMEHDVLVGYAKAFSTDDPELFAIRRQCYARIHLVLAGSYFRAGQPYDFARHALRSIWYAPGNFTRVLGFPVRWLQRQVEVDASHPPAKKVSDPHL